MQDFLRAAYYWLGGDHMKMSAVCIGTLLLNFAFQVGSSRADSPPPLQLSHDSTVRIVSVAGNSSGSGFMIGDDLVLTCLHVVVQIQPTGNGVNLVPLQDITVILPNGEAVPATIISLPTQQDPDPATHDYAFLRLAHKPTSTFQKVQLAKEEEATKLGDDVVFSGYPLSTPGMVTHKGMVSGSDSTKEIIFIEASINKGNSGGALLNSKGEVVGIVSMREGGITQGLADLRTKIIQNSRNGSVTIMGLDPLSSTKALIDTLDQYISTGIGYARTIRFARSYLIRHHEVGAVGALK
jgi:V8-like Glu-specific endopeptidase